MSQLEELRRRYIDERPTYERLAKAVRERLEREARGQGLMLQFDHRAKEVPSLVKKALLWGLSYEEIPDKAGARVVYQYDWHLSALEEIIQEVFVVLRRDDKAVGLEPHELRYLGVHYDVRFKNGDAEAPPDLDLAESVCEIQLHTRQQSAWAAYSHELLYKVPQEPPRAVRRAVHRLLALVEIFDREVNMARETILQQPGYEAARVLERLEREFYRLTAREFDPELSRRVLEAILPLYETDKLGRLLDRFLAERRSKIDRIYETYVEDPRATPMLFQPEALLLFEALDRMPTKLESTFSAVAPKELLEELAVVWGEALD